MTLSLLQARPNEAPARHLLQALYAAQLELYPSADPAEIDPTEHAPPHGVFLLAYAPDHAAPVGCGAVRTWDERTAEVRKMYVAPSHRGIGVGQHLLAALERFALTTIGAQQMLLETGIHNHTALTLYTRAGYTRRSSYVAGRGHVNVAFEKQLHHPEPKPSASPSRS